jgi:proteasome lid subunit RPN8/RPN11
MRFVIDKIIPPYRPIPKREESLPTDEKLNSFVQEGADKRKKITLMPKARQVVMNHIAWAQKTKDNVVEQGGILIGHVYFDAEKDLTYAIVSEAIPAIGARGTTAYLELNHEVWKNMIDKADEILDAQEEPKQQIIGWYHTHPNDLSVFMSGTDLRTQQTLFCEDWQFAIVLNPHRKIWRAFYGMYARECYGFMISEADL